MQVHLSNKRLGLVTDEIDKAAPGTVEAALRNLIAYRSSLENRLLARFMDACSQTVRAILSRMSTKQNRYKRPGVLYELFIPPPPSWHTQYHSSVQFVACYTLSDLFQGV